MIGIGKGGQREVQTTMMSLYACYLKRGEGTVFDFGCASSLCPELGQGLCNLNGLLPRN